MYARSQYLGREVSHEDYYRQFCHSGVVGLVKSVIGEAAILSSQDKQFNDIPLAKWDRLFSAIVGMCGRSHKIADPGGMSLSDAVCIAKQAAQIIREQHKA